jgi:hypothetical protein
MPSKTSKTYDYIVVLKSRDFKSVDTITLLMLLMAIVVLLEDAFTPFSQASAFPISLSALILGWTAFTFAKRYNGKTAYFRFATLIAAWGLFVTLPTSYAWIAAAYVIAAVLEKQIKFPREIAFDEQEIVFNRFPRKYYQWGELNNVVLKDGMLTVDFKNNLLIQKHIDSQVTPQMENEFNRFCRNLLDNNNTAPKA